jgi:hypothetical protein
MEESPNQDKEEEDHSHLDVEEEKPNPLDRKGAWEARALLKECSARAINPKTKTKNKNQKKKKKKGETDIRNLSRCGL